MPEDPAINYEDREEIRTKLGELLLRQNLGLTDASQADESQHETVRLILNQFEGLVGNLQSVASSIENDDLSPGSNAYRSLKYLLQNEEFAIQFAEGYANAFKDATDSNSSEAQTQGYQLLALIDLFREYIKTKEGGDPSLDVEDRLQAAIDQMGSFKADIKHLDTNNEMQKRLSIRTQGKWRKDNPPEAVAPWRCRIGASTFYVPPTSISVIQNYKASSLAGAAIRQPNSPKINLGHSETTILMTLYFPTHETIWGFEGDEADWQFHNWDPASNIPQSVTYYGVETASAIVDDKVIDRYLSSLRGLITQFKYMPFLPVDNQYLNQAHDIDAVVMKNMTVSTVENYPFVAAVTLEMGKFNYDPYMPMIEHFDQAIHWGKFRQMAGRCAANLQNRVNKGFLVTYRPDPNVPDHLNDYRTTETSYEGEYTDRPNKRREIADGRDFDLYYPVSTPSRIFAPDTTDFRQPGEDEFFTRDYWDFLIGDLGFVVTETPSFNFFEFDNKRKFNTNEREILRQWLGWNVEIWENMNSDQFAEFMDYAVAQAQQNGTLNPSNESSFRARLKNEWFYVLFDEILTNDPVFQKIQAAKESGETEYVIKEWEVPMARVDIDWDRCIVTGVGVNLSNTFASLQLQMQDEPTFQHIGGGDSTIDVEMTVLGKDNIRMFRRAFQHINGLARLERSHGVLGYVGIKNVFTALSGIKYAIPTAFEVDTIPGVPDVYKLRLSFVDFDVMQQQRERLDSGQQKSLIDTFGKGNPFFRLKQQWGQTNCYPDFPLSVRDDDNKIIGHMDPDWYFRSFRKDNKDLVDWGLDRKVSDLVAEYSYLTEINSRGNDPHNRAHNDERLDEISRELRSLASELVELPTGWEFDPHGNIKSLSDTDFYNPDKREYRYYLGAYGEAQEKTAVMDMFQGGVFLLGEISDENEDPDKPEYVTGYSVMSEDLATKNRYNFPTVENTVGVADYQNEYQDGAYNPSGQYQSMMQDWDYRALDGRMIKAFPTYMLWLIDEGGRFAGIKLFDNLYGLNSIIDFSLSQSAADPISDTLILRLSNIYQKLTRSYKDALIDEDSPLAESPGADGMNTVKDRADNLKSGLYDHLVELDNIRLKPGVRVHLRAGWGNNPNALQTIFNGTITEVQAGQVMTVVAQTDAVELSAFVNSTSVKDHSGKLDGAMNNFWLSEPRDLMVRLLSMGSSRFKEWLSWGSKGVIFSESRYGIRHFGNILYPPMTKSEADGTYNMQANGYSGIHKERSAAQTDGDNFQALLGASLEDFSETTNVTDFLPGSALSGTLAALTRALFVNNLARRDYEVFKRNIYPGNGMGVAQFMGGDLLDAGILTTQVGTTYSNDPSANADPYVVGGNPNLPDHLSTRDNGPTSNSQDITEGDLDRNNDAIADWWRTYIGDNGLTEEEFLEFMATAQSRGIEIEIEDDGVGAPGFLDHILDAIGFGVNPLGTISSFADPIGDVVDAIGGWGIFDKNPVLDLTRDITVGTLKVGVGILKVGDGVHNGLFAFKNSSVGQALGLSQIISDDDIEGFDEVAFRAQTYMKTVWDLFQTCAALLPNYIVAVRPFEDRSTVFYGKPHWLYTSGLIPVTTGVQTELQGGLSKLLDPDEVITNILDVANGTNVQLERMVTAAKQTGALKDIEAFLLKNYDPNNITDVTGDISLVSAEAIALAFEDVAKQASENDVDLDILGAFNAFDYSTITSSELTTLSEVVEALTKDKITLAEQNKIDGIFRNNEFEYENDTVREAGERFLSVYWELDDAPNSSPQQAFQYFLSTWLNAREEVREGGNIDSGEIHDFQPLLEQISEDESLDPYERIELKNLLRTDPITFAYQFGWRYSRAPIWIGPEARAGYDIFGEFARQRYDETHDKVVDVIGGNSGRTLKQARDIWYDFRRVYRYRPEVVDLYKRTFPFDTEGENYDALVDTFMRFLWQDPYNRAWVVLRAELHETAPSPSQIWDAFDDSIGGSDYYEKMINFDGSSAHVSAGGGGSSIFGNLPIIGGDDGNTGIWFFDGVDGAWERFLISNDVKFNDQGVPVSGATKAWMRANAQEASENVNPVAGAIVDVKEWFDENIGQVIGLITDSITGLIAATRLSLAQLSQGLSISGEMNRQANVLNATLMDSVYYQLGEGRDDLLRLVDNPFTREYNEPVVEIREPFQRVHMINSSRDILHNDISENLNGVATVVTAVSDGKNPVTVHFDKGVPPDRQTETTVETGIYWDNTFGSGFFGFLQPLINPLEAIRGFKKTLEGTSDQLSAKRIGLYHLKNSLKDIYQGEIIILGNTDIRPFDLLYIADSYERIYGMVEVGQVIHHFTPETGFITSITPDALVSVNDPARWSMTSYLANKLMNNVVRDEMRALMNIGVDRFVAQGLDYLYSEDLYTQFSDHIEGAVQWTQGSTALVRDLGAVFAGGGIQALTERDRQAAKLLQLDIGVGALRAASVAGTVAAGAGLGSLGGPGPGTAVGGAIGLGAGLAIGDLQWKAWQWVKDNILDQHGCYIQYLTKEGQPMDAGLSYFEGSAVGSNHMLSLFPTVFGIPIVSPKVNVQKDGHFRITTNDLLANLGWTEVETLALYRDTSFFVNEVNDNILKLAGRGPDGGAISNDAYIVFTGVIDRVVDGDTVDVKILGTGENSPYSEGEVERVRVAAINTLETFTVDEQNDPTSAGYLAKQYLQNKFFSGSNPKTVAVRVKAREGKDDYGRTIGTIFHNTPTTTPPSARVATLREFADANPPIPMSSYLEDGRPYTLNWEMVMTGYANIDMRESLWETDWRDDALGRGDD